MKLTLEQRRTNIYRRQCRRIAGQFKYPETVMAAIETATTENELERIMRNARKQYA